MRFLKWLFGARAIDVKSVQQAEPKPATPGPAINEGNIHSGNAGYSPNTPYVETQYGSGFDEEADWAEHDH
jgi:hypothetical protein